MREDVQAVIEQFRPGMQADGADLLLDDVADGVVRVRLVFGPDTCEECILPPADLAAHLQVVLQEQVPAVTRVVVEEQRPAQP